MTQLIERRRNRADFADNNSADAEIDRLRLALKESQLALAESRAYTTVLTARVYDIEAALAARKATS